MNVITAIRTRRAYRSLKPVRITKRLVNDLATSAGLAASCFNKQPWYFVFAYDPGVLAKMHNALSRGNEWARKSSMIIAVASKKEYDCIINDGREYYLFDTGMAAAQLILRATELGLVAHPIAGFDQVKVKELLKIPVDMTVITLIIVGKRSNSPGPLLSPDQAATEKKRPPRKKPVEFAFYNRYVS